MKIAALALVFAACSSTRPAVVARPATLPAPTAEVEPVPAPDQRHEPEQLVDLEVLEAEWARARLRSRLDARP